MQQFFLINFIWGTCKFITFLMSDSTYNYISNISRNILVIITILTSV